MTIEESKNYIEMRMQWHIREDTFKIIEEETCTWVADVTTIYLAQNISFFILVQGYNHFIIEKRWRHKLGEWLAQHL